MYTLDVRYVCYVILCIRVKLHVLGFCGCVCVCCVTLNNSQPSLVCSLVIHWSVCTLWLFTTYRAYIHPCVSLNKPVFSVQTDVGWSCPLKRFVISCFFIGVFLCVHHTPILDKKNTLFFNTSRLSFFSA